MWGYKTRITSDLLSGTTQAISETISRHITRDKEGHFKIEDPIHQEDMF